MDQTAREVINKNPRREVLNLIVDYIRKHSPEGVEGKNGR